MAFDPITAGINVVGKFVDKFVADKDLAAKLKAQAESQEFSGELQLLLGQMAINQEEAKSDSVFVAGWRPFIGWVCGLGLGYVALLEPVARFVAQVLYQYTGPFPQIDTSLTMQVLLGLLGLGAMRSYDKRNGVSREKL